MRFVRREKVAGLHLRPHTSSNSVVIPSDRRRFFGDSSRLHIVSLAPENLGAAGVAVGHLSVLHVDVPDDLVDAIAVIHGALQDLGDLASLAELRVLVERGGDEF